MMQGEGGDARLTPRMSHHDLNLKERSGSGKRPGRHRTACIACRVARRKCDGGMPCGRYVPRYKYCPSSLYDAFLEQNPAGPFG